MKTILALRALLTVALLGLVTFAKGAAHKAHAALFGYMHSQGMVLAAYTMELTDLQNVVPGNVATLKLPAGAGAPTYDNISLILGGGLTPAHIESVRGKIGGRIFLDEGSGTEIQDRDDYRGIFTEAGVLNIDFTEPKARNGAAEQLVAAVPGALCSSILLEIKLAAGAPVGSTMKALTDYRPPTSNPYVRKLLSINQFFGAAGTEAAPNILQLPVGAQGGKVKRLWIKETTPGNITGVEIRIANNVVSKSSRARLENNAKRFGLVPQSGLVVVDFISDGNLAGLLDTEAVPGCELRLITTAGELVKVYQELLDPIGRL